MNNTKIIINDRADEELIKNYNFSSALLRLIYNNYISTIEESGKILQYIYVGN